jgi:hypothetical protein
VILCRPYFSSAPLSGERLYSEHAGWAERSLAASRRFHETALRIKFFPSWGPSSLSLRAKRLAFAAVHLPNTRGSPGVSRNNANSSPGVLCPEVSAAASAAFDASWSPDTPLTEPSAAESPVRFNTARGLSTAGGTLSGSSSPDDVPAAAAAASADAAADTCAAANFVRLPRDATNQ